MGKPKVLLTFIESGMGHIMSMRAIEDSLREKYSDQLEIIFSNIMQEADYPSLKIMEKFLVRQTINTNRSKIYSHSVFFIMSLLGKEHLMRLTNKTVFRLATERLIETIMQINPDIIVCNHYYITACAIVARDKHLPNLKVVTYNPDNNVHVWWDPKGDLFINNNPLATQESMERGFPKESLREVHFVARKEVRTAKESKAFYRQKYQIDDCFTVLISDGAYASGKAYPVLKKLLTIRESINILFIAGKNQKLLDKLLKLKTKPNIHLLPLGFQEKIYELYKASDLFITKAGPNAILDCVYMGTPVLVDLYAHPIEKATAKLFIDYYQVGEACYAMGKIKETVLRLKNEPEYLAKYQANIQAFERDFDGASEVADLIKQEAEGLKNE